MNILHTTDLSRPGNIHEIKYIYESINLASEFGMYFIIKSTKILGPNPQYKVMCLPPATCDLQQAEYLYEAAGGVLDKDTTVKETTTITFTSKEEL